MPTTLLAEHSAFQLEDNQWGDPPAAPRRQAFMHPKLASIEARTGGKTHEDRLEELQRMANEDEG